ncbi:MAG: citramalate synthase [Planctomycetia bacterium]|nr:citramalate synthase [Planctomycetia bacterium]
MRRIEIYDTTLRDGAQAEGISFSLQDKLLLTERLDSLGFDYVEGGYPASNDKDSRYFQRVADLGLQHIKVCAFGMTRRKGTRAEDDSGLRALVDSKAPVVTLVGKASAFQAREVIRAGLDENLAMIRDSVRMMVDTGREVIFDAEHFFDGWKDDPEYSLRAIQTAADAGARLVVLCDTNGGTMCDEVFEITAAAIAALGVPVGVHCHNDCDLAVANSLAAVRAGASHVQGTINGFGERCGNADLVSIVANLALKHQDYDVLASRGIEHLTELSRFVYETANVNFRANQPFVGKSAFAHKGGMHVSGVSRITASYEHVDPERVGNERRILVSELSGRSNIVELTTKFDIRHDPKLMDKILARVVSMENAGYQFEAAGGSFDLLVKKCAGTFKPHFERIGYHVNVETREDGKITTEATVKIRIGDEVRHEVAEGDGPINALDAAMRKALNGRFPALASIHLVDYKVRVINSEAATAAGVRVVIESQDETDVWGTVGVSENVIEASWIALVDSLEYKLCKDEEK